LLVGKVLIFMGGGGLVLRKYSDEYTKAEAPSYLFFEMYFASFYIYKKDLGSRCIVIPRLQINDQENF